MAIKKGNVRLQVTITESDMRDLDELCELYGGWSKSRAVSHAIFAALVEARVEKVEREKEGQEGAKE